MRNEVKNTSCIEDMYNEMTGYWNRLREDGLTMEGLATFKHMQKNLLAVTEYVYNNPVIEDKENKIELTNERTVDMVEFDFEIGSGAYKMLRDYAINNILRDDKELINWAVNDILRKKVEEAECEDGEDSEYPEYPDYEFSAMDDLERIINDF